MLYSRNREEKKEKYTYKMFLKIKIYWSSIIFMALFSLSFKGKVKPFLLKEILSYSFSGLSIVFIIHILVNIINNYPPKIIGISP